MAETATKLPVTRETAVAPRGPFRSLRREIDRLFEDFDRDFWGFPIRRSLFDIEPSWQRELGWSAAPAVDVTENDNAYEITAELPGMDEKNIDVKLADGSLMIKGEKAEEKEEKAKDYHVHERRFGSFERCFSLPDGVDTDKIEASFKKGVLTVTLPKKEAAKPRQVKVEVKQ